MRIIFNLILFKRVLIAAAPTLLVVATVRGSTHVRCDANTINLAVFFLLRASPHYVATLHGCPSLSALKR